MLSPRYGDRVKAFAFTNLLLFVVFLFVFPPAAWLLAVLSVAVDAWIRFAKTSHPQQEAVEPHGGSVPVR
jgi:hypothetical protein